jgi:uncharacterized membrane protein YfcA
MKNHTLWPVISLPASGISALTGWAPVTIGFLVGIVTGLMGVGGGFLLTPALNILFGIPYPVAVGSDLLMIFCTGSVSAFKHWKRKNVDVRLGAILACSAVVGAEAGKRLMGLLERGGDGSELTVTILSQEHSLLKLTLDILFLILLGAVMLTILNEKPDTETGETNTGISKWLHGIKLSPLISLPASGLSALTCWAPVFIGFLVGIVTGLMGVGGGFIMFPIMVYVIGVPTSIAVGTSAFQILFASGYGAFAHFAAGHVEFRLVAMLLCGSMIGVQIGVYASARIGNKNIRKYFSFVIGLAILMILYSLIKNLFF